MRKRTLLMPATMVLMMATAHAEEGDGVTAMCLDRYDADACACASKALRGEVSAEDFELYDAIGADYMERLEAGEDMSAAWSAASDTQAERLGVKTSGLLKRTNAIGRAHRAAIKACSGED
ncbi:hypothetical protein F3N42_09440 [Marinihelvus fidelis]|uniref:Lysozyme inhibitor LprI N-terminal domain-containing protein n=1 Tax=Marinihelvus fidelis TaxID=2613842 RepID=A0A5N0T9B1_9GAMM|nr:hypothetical protein [Marinihelvus fidelis]KAA9131530.1 hypothetical protein F3N42_09440 [Marinihelvus fidelis]